MKPQILCFLALSLTLTAILFVGCKEPVYDGLEISNISTAPRPAEIEVDGSGFVSKGVSVAISVKPLSSNDKDYQVTDEIEIVSQDETVLLVSPSFYPSVFVLTGLDLGQTCMAIIINGKEEECIDVSVVEDMD